MDAEAHKPGWQHDLRDKWLLASAGYFSGCISPCLDEFLTDSNRVQTILQVSERAVRSLRGFGVYVPATFLNALGITGPFAADLPIDWFELMHSRFTSLLRGELATDASTSSVLPATRQDQKWEEITQPRNAEPGGAANRSQPVGPQANETPSAAGSGD